MSNGEKKRGNLVVITSRSRFSGSISQADIAELKFRRRELMEIEDAMAVALSHGARVEPGLHKAELVPEPRTAGHDLFLKLVILIFFFAMLPAICSRASIIEDVNGDGKIDAQDLTESSPSPSPEKESPHA